MFTQKEKMVIRNSYLYKTESNEDVETRISNAPTRMLYEIMQEVVKKCHPTKKSASYLDELYFHTTLDCLGNIIDIFGDNKDEQDHCVASMMHNCPEIYGKHVYHIQRTIAYQISHGVRDAWFTQTAQGEKIIRDLPRVQQQIAAIQR